MIRLVSASCLLIWIAFLCASIKCRPSGIPDPEQPDNGIQTIENETNLLQALKDLIHSNENITSQLKGFSIPQDTLIQMVDSPFLTIFFETFPQLKPYEGGIKQITKDLIKTLS